MKKIVTIKHTLLFLIINTIGLNALALGNYRIDSVEIMTMMEGIVYPIAVHPNGDRVIIQEFVSSDVSYLWDINDGITVIEGNVSGISNAGKIYGDFTKEDFELPNGTTEPTICAGEFIPETSTWEFLGLSPDYPNGAIGDYSSAQGVSENNVVVGMVFDEGYTAHAYKWTPEKGYTDLSEGLTDGSSRASAVSGNGEVCVGFYSTDFGIWSPIVWKGEQQIKLKPGGDGEAISASYDGTYVGGYVDGQAFIWSEETGMEYIGSSDKMVTCILETGEAFGFSGWLPDQRTAFYLNKNHQITSFQDYLIDRGVKDADKWFFYSVNKVSKDGNIFIGNGTNPEGQAVAFIINFNQTSSIENNLSSDISIYPNPVNNLITINNIQANSVIGIYDLTGKCIYNLTTDSSKEQLDLSSLKQGQYIIRIIINDNIFHHKIIKL